MKPAGNQSGCALLHHTRAGVQGSAAAMETSIVAGCDVVSGVSRHDNASLN